MGYINNEERTLAIPNNKDWYGTEGYGDYGIIYVDTIPIGVVLRSHLRENATWDVFRWFVFKDKPFEYKLKCVEGKTPIHLARRDGKLFGLKVYTLIKCSQTLGSVSSEVHSSRISVVWKSTHADPINIAWSFPWVCKYQDEEGNYKKKRRTVYIDLGHDNHYYVSTELDRDNKLSYAEFISRAEYSPFLRFNPKYYEDRVVFEVIRYPYNDEALMIFDMLHNKAFSLYWGDIVSFDEISLDEYYEKKEYSHIGDISVVNLNTLLDKIEETYQNYLKDEVAHIAKKAVYWDYDTPYKEYHVYVNNGEYIAGSHINHIRLTVAGVDKRVLLKHPLSLWGKEYEEEYLSKVKELKELIDTAVEKRKQEYQEYLEKKEKESEEPDKLTGRRARRIRLSEEDLEETEN